MYKTMYVVRVVASNTMSIDKFGRYHHNLPGVNRQGPPGIGFKLTNDGDFDIENKKLTNVGDPESPTDAVNNKTLIDKLERVEALAVSNKVYNETAFRTINDKVTNSIAKIPSEINDKVIETFDKIGPNRCIYKITTDEADYSAGNNRITQVADPQDILDAANMAYVDALEVRIDMALNKINERFNKHIGDSHKTLEMADNAIKRFTLTLTNIQQDIDGIYAHLGLTKPST